MCKPGQHVGAVPLDEEGGGLYHAVHGLLPSYARARDAKALGANRATDPLPPRGMFGTDPL